jgi:hypothetical protein
MLAMNSPLATIQHGLCCASLGQAKNNKTGSRPKKHKIKFCLLEYTRTLKPFSKYIDKYYRIHKNNVATMNKLCCSKVRTVRE